jgi:hypothetical protein
MIAGVAQSSPTGYPQDVVKARVKVRKCFRPLSAVMLGLVFAILPAQAQKGRYSISGGMTGKDPQTMTSLKETNHSEPPASFYEALGKTLKKRKIKLDSICPPTDAVARRVLEDYGAMFLADKKVTPPPVCVFTSDAQVAEFQERAGYTSELFGFDQVELQPEAMKHLLKARKEAQEENLDITPRDGAEAGRRSYDDSLQLWRTRFLPALQYWLGQQKLTDEQVERLKTLPLRAQVSEVLELEKNGIYFSKDLSKSILYSIAAPGTSQHIAMLAFDVNEFDNPRVREILARHGWFQTVLSDLPHFTFLGLKEKDLPKYGLKRTEVDGQTFWIPNVVAGDTTPNSQSQ